MVENNTYCVYRHVRLDTNKVFYVGVGVDLKRPYFTFGRNKSWNEVVSSTDYRVDIVLESLSRSEVLLKEREFIILYGRIDLGTGTLVNKNSGGQGGQDGDRKMTPDFVSNLKKHAKNHLNSFDSVQKRAASQIGQFVSKERVLKGLLTKKLNGYFVSDATKKSISKSHKNPYIVYQKHPVTKEVLNTFSSFMGASNSARVAPQNISRATKLGNISGGYIWERKFVNE